jgi:hypothetical protein
MRKATGAVIAAILIMLAGGPAAAQEFPFGAEMTLDARPLPGSKRVPSLEIDDKGAVRLELWCKGGTGQFSVAGDTVIFVPGTLEARNCPADRAQLDDALLAALSEATGWKRDSQTVTFVGPKPLRFRLLSN